MSDKAIIVADMQESCSKCKFMYEFYGVKKCQLLNILKNGGKAIICVDKLNVARKECCPLVSAEEYDKEIRDKVVKRIIERIEEARQKYQRLCREQGENEDEVMNIHFRGITKIIKEEASENVREIAERMKEVGE